MATDVADAVTISLKTKITILTSVLLTVLIIVSVYYTIGYFRKELYNKIAENQFALVSTLAHEMDDKLGVGLDILVAETDRFTEDLMRDSDRAQKFLDGARALSTIFDNATYIFTPDGKLFAESPYLPDKRRADFSHREYVQKAVAGKGAYISDPYVSTQSGRTIIMIAVPLMDRKSRVIAILAGSMDLMNDSFTGGIDHGRPGRGRYLFFFDRNGIMIEHPDKSLIMRKAEFSGGSPLFEKAVRGFEGTGEMTDFSGARVLASFKGLHKKPWVLSAAYPLDDAYDPIRRAEKFLLWGGLVTIATVIAFVYAAAGRLTRQLSSITRHIEQLPRKSGEGRHISVHTRDEVGVLAAKFNEMIDTMDRQYRAVAENELLLREIFSNSPAMTHSFDESGVITSVNKKWLEATGYEAAEVVGRRFTEFLTESGRNRYASSGDPAVGVENTGEEALCELVRKDGTVIEAVVNRVEIEVASGKRTGVAILWDVTAKKSMERELRDSELKYRALTENLPDIIMRFDRQFRHIYVSPSVTNFVSIKPVSFIGRTHRDLKFPPDKALFWENSIRQVFETGTMLDFEYEFEGRDGKLNFNWRLLPEFDENGAVATVLSIARDVTVHRQMEQQVRHIQKMESVGTLTGGIAHDFNNILTAIIGYASMMSLRVGQDDPIRTFIDQILSASERAASLTEGLLAFSRKQTVNLKAVDFNVIVTNVLQLLKRIIREDIELSTDLSADRLMVLADYLQMEQMLVNLTTNARDAMPEGGAITIATCRTALGRDFVQAHGYGEPGDYAVITFSDTGTGIDKDMQAKIFDPFFTTKDVGKGTGLGLSVVYGIIKQHNGYINVYSEPGSGTTFRIYLPLLKQGESPSAHAPAPAKPALVGTETILIAEDEEKVMELLSSVLTSFGYSVITAVDGEEAVVRYAENRDRIDAVLLDVIMPKKSGRAVCGEIRSINPAARVVFMSGYTGEFLTRDGLIAEKTDFIPKPISPTELLLKIRTILDKGKA